MIRYVLTVITSILLLIGASSEKRVGLQKPLFIKSTDSKSDIPVVDYDKIKKAVSDFRFYPVSFYLSTDGCNTIKTRFNKDSDINIDICAGFNIIDDFHYLRFEFITPDDSVYQSLNYFIDNPNSTQKMVKFRNDYTLYPVVSAEILKGISIIRGSLPLAGSSIQVQNLTGKWRVDLYLDDSRVAYGTCEFEVE